MDNFTKTHTWISTFMYSIFKVIKGHLHVCIFDTTQHNMRTQ